MAKKTFYDVLQVSPYADTEIIKAAYNSLMQRFYPDGSSGDPNDDFFKALNKAFDVLSDPAKREGYDAALSTDGDAGIAQLCASSQSSIPMQEPEEIKVASAGGSGASSGQMLGQQSSIQNNNDESDYSDYEYAGFWERFAALLLDGFVLLAFIIPAWIVLWVSVARGWGSQDVIVTLTYLVSWAISAAYFSVMESGEKSATYGKRWMGLKVFDVDRERISGWRAFARWLYHFLSNITLYVGYFIQPFTQRKQALHDMASGTVVVRSEHEKKSAGVVIAVAIAASFVLVLVVGAVAAIAIPVYQDFQKRASVTPSMTGETKQTEAVQPEKSEQKDSSPDKDGAGTQFDPPDGLNAYIASRQAGSSGKTKPERGDGPIQGMFSIPADEVNIKSDRYPAGRDSRTNTSEFNRWKQCLDRHQISGNDERQRISAKCDEEARREVAGKTVAGRPRDNAREQ